MRPSEELINAIKNSKLWNKKKLREQVCRFCEIEDRRIENLEENIRNNNNLLLTYEIRMQELQKKVFETNNALNELKSQMVDLCKNIVGNNDYINNHIVNHKLLEENIRNNNEQLCKMQHSLRYVEGLQERLDEYLKYCLSIKNELKSMRSNEAKIDDNRFEDDKVHTEKVVNTIPEQEYSKIDYFDFEDHFRGSREKIKEVQFQYLKYFEGKRNVLDLGCGRGEFLELLKEHGINAIGIDFYGEFIEYCKLNKLIAIEGDAIAYLNQVDSTDGIFAGQLVEHLDTNQIIELCRLAYNKLTKGSYIVLETPNPTSLAIYSHAFYIDPSHQKPVHPLTLKYYMEKAGFKDIEIIYTESSKLPVKIPTLNIEKIDNINEFNASMKEIEKLLFGSQDYAIVAKK